MKHILSHNVCDKSYLDRILSHWNTNTTTMILILTTRINCLTRLWRNLEEIPLPHSKKPHLQKTLHICQQVLLAMCNLISSLILLLLSKARML